MQVGTCSWHTYSKKICSATSVKEDKKDVEKAKLSSSLRELFMSSSRFSKQLNRLLLASLLSPCDLIKVRIQSISSVQLATIRLDFRKRPGLDVQTFKKDPVTVRSFCPQSAQPDSNLRLCPPSAMWFL